MIKFTGVREGKEFVGIGLSRANCSKLLEGKPILVDLRKIGAHNTEELFIMAGESEQEMQDELARMGLLHGVPIRLDSSVEHAGKIPLVRMED